MKKILGLCFCFLSLSAIAGVPFGLTVGMPLSTVKKVSGNPEVLSRYSYSFKKVPTPYKGFEDYLMVITPKNGLCKVIGYGEKITTNVYGDDLRFNFNKVKESLIKKYGQPEVDFDFLRAGSIWRNSEDWTMSLYKEERVLSAGWEPNEVNGIKNIMLKVNGLGRNTGRIVLSYELSNFDACDKEKEASDIAGL